MMGGIVTSERVREEGGIGSVVVVEEETANEMRLEFERVLFRSPRLRTATGGRRRHTRNPGSPLDLQDRKRDV